MHTIFNQNIHIITKPSNHYFIDEWYDIANEDHFWMKWRYTAFINQLRYLNILENKKLTGADIGCGRGVLRKQLANSTQWIIDGIEMGLEALKNNPSINGSLYLYDINERKDFLKEHYDFMILFDVLEHIQ